MVRSAFDGVAVAASSAVAGAPTQKATHSLWGSVRLTYAICAFVSMVVQLLMRSTLNFVILCMVQSDGEMIENMQIPPRAISPCAAPAQVNGTDMLTEGGTLTWSRGQAILIQGAFYYGYVISLPIAGHLADRFGGKFCFIHSITAQAVIFMLIPTLAKISFTAAFIGQLIQGTIAGAGNPSLYQLFSTWAHPTERSMMVTFAYGGYPLGVLLCYPLSGLLCQIGWEMSFYIMGGLSLCFGISCQWLVYNTLEEHPRITAEERDYLKVASAQKSQTPKVPWGKILTSAPVYAFVVTHFSHTYGMILLTLVIPRFLKEAMGYSLQQASIYATAPFLGAVLSKFVAIYMSNKIEKRPNINLTLYRRILYVTCNVFTTSFIFVVIFLDCTNRLYVVLCTSLMFIFADIAFGSGYWPSLLFFAPTYAGLLSGIANCLATCSGFLAPMVISYIVPTGAKDEWNYVLVTLIASYIVGAAIYGMFGSSKLQSWNSNSNNKNNKGNNIT